MVEHNHLTRDIKRPGVCPACDRYHARSTGAVPSGPFPTMADARYALSRFPGFDQLQDRLQGGPTVEQAYRGDTSWQRAGR